MNHRTVFALLLAASVTACRQAPAPPAETTPPAAASAIAGSVVRLDPALDALVPPDAVVEKVATGFGFTEGPLWRPSESRLWFSDVTGNAVHAVTPAGVAATLIEKAGGEFDRAGGVLRGTERDGGR